MEHTSTTDSYLQHPSSDTNDILQSTMLASGDHSGTVHTDALEELTTSSDILLDKSIENHFASNDDTIITQLPAHEVNQGSSSISGEDCSASTNNINNNE